MSDKKVELTRRKVLGGLATIGAAGAATGAGTMAAFSDTETSSANTVSAGTLNLSMNTTNDAAISLTNAKPGDSGFIALELVNEGSLAGSLDVNIGSVAADGSFSASLVTDSDGTDSEFESSPGSDGELDDNINVEVGLDDSFTGTTGYDEGGSYSGTIDTSIVSDTLANAVGSYNTNKPIAANGDTGDSTTLILTYSIPTSAGNDIQGDSVAFDIQAELNQNDSQ